MTTTLKINDSDIRDYIDVITAWTNLVGAPPLVDNDYPVPGQMGALASPSYFGPRVITIQGLLVGSLGQPRVVVPTDSYNQMLERLRQLSTLVQNSYRTFGLTRVLSFPGQADKVSVGTGRYLSGLDQAAAVAQIGNRVSLDIRLLEGIWHDQDATVQSLSTGSQNITAVGDLDTRRIVLTLTNTGANCRVTNTTNGTWVQVSGAPGASNTVALGVEAFSAIKTVSAVESNVIGQVTHSQDVDNCWLVLQPGVNNIVVANIGSGSISMSYKGARL